MSNDSVKLSVTPWFYPQTPQPCSAEAATIGRHRLADGAARRRGGA